MLIWLLTLTFAGLQPVAAADWHRYQNKAYGYKIDLAPGFAAPDDSDKSTIDIQGPGGSALTLSATAKKLNPNTELRSRMAKAKSDGFTLIYPSLGPGFVILAGTKPGKNFYEKAISSCGGNRSVVLRIDYSDAAAGSINSSLDRLATSLADSGKC